MIRIGDAFILAYTKLRVHKIRTGLTSGIAGLLFGLMLLAVIVVQGVFDSVDRFSDEGLNDRAIVEVTHSSADLSFNPWEMAADPAFVAEVEAAHKQLVAKKMAAAKKYNVPYDASVEDSSPIGIDPDTKQRVVTIAGLDGPVVQGIMARNNLEKWRPFDVKEYLKAYPSAKVLGKHTPIVPSDGSIEYMKDGKESTDVKNERQRLMSQYSDDSISLVVMDGSLTKPFLTDESFDVTSGEVPVVIPFSRAAKLLGLEPLGSKVSAEEKLARLAEVRQRVGEITVSFCYRNQASLALFAEATQQTAEIRRNEANKDYHKPNLIYALPSNDSCGAVTIASDTRTAAEKRLASNRELYEKELGTHPGEPRQHKLVLRGAGISSDMSSTGAWSITDMIKGILNSNLGWNTWAIPADLLNEVPESQRPEAIFASPTDGASAPSGYSMHESYLVEFADRTEARKLLEKAGTFGGDSSENVYAMPFGSGVLLVDEMKRIFMNIMLWSGVVIGAIAIIILGGLIGRAVADGRRESAVFRAIGASRGDIGKIYGTFAFLLGLRIAAFALMMGVVLAFVVELFLWRDATFVARLAYAAKDTNIEFHLFSLVSWYVPAILMTIVIVGLIASILPILLGARRNPITDMRNDT